MRAIFSPVALVVHLLVFSIFRSSAEDGVITFPVQLAVHTANFTSVDGNVVEGAVAEGFTARVNLGTPPQQISLYIDTGSSDIAVASYDESNLTTHFFTSRSSSYVASNEAVSKKFVEGRYNGTVGSDILHDLATTSFQVPVIAITSSQDMFPARSKWQGLWGLAFPHLTVQKSFMEALSAEKGINHFLLAFCDRHEMDSTQNFGVLSFNGKIPEGMFFTPVFMPTYFSVYVANIRVGSKEWPGSCNEVYFQEVTLKRGDNACYKLGMSPSSLGTVIGFSIIRGLTTVFDLGSRSVGFSPLECNGKDVIVRHADKNFSGHSCVWDLPAMGGKTWTVFQYVILFICLMCAAPTLIIGLMWLKRRIHLYKARSAPDGVGLVEF
ncbi:hypothetical protein HPB48_012445 [Haemaphysalis longicornis]|uniref:Peptidase A1 domain-containing protein n=1 Tax=Haemaphysalis longicornis TaxID=44386 RepID=A0A9J6G2T3_HAELO|nr:hypothetical protein HPB48_012445 [Haemaphysalis longicornis]